MQRFYFIVFLLAFSACKTRKETVSKFPVNAKQPVKDSVLVVKQEKPVEYRKFNLSLLLSLNATQYLAKDSVGNYLLNEIEASNINALEFYEGLQLAKDKGDSIFGIHISDIGDSTRLVKTLKDSCWKKSDLVIAITPQSMNVVIANNPAMQGIPLMFPLNQVPAKSFSNRNNWSAIPSNKTQCKQMAHYLKESNLGAQYIIIYRGDNKNETELADLFNDEFYLIFNDSVSRKLNYSADGWNKLLKNLQTTKRNVLIIPSSDESFLSSLIIKLDKQEQYPFLLAGLPTWEHFESIDIDILENLNAHIFDGSYIDYENEQVKAFRKRFIDEYQADPLLSAYLGYDLYNWIKENYSRYNVALDKYESKKALVAPQSGFKFMRTCENCMMENRFITVLLFKEGALKIVNH